MGCGTWDVGRGGTAGLLKDIDWLPSELANWVPSEVPGRAAPASPCPAWFPNQSSVICNLAFQPSDSRAWSCSACGTNRIHPHPPSSILVHTCLHSTVHGIYNLGPCPRSRYLYIYYVHRSDQMRYSLQTDRQTDHTRSPPSRDGCMAGERDALLGAVDSIAVLISMGFVSCRCAPQHRISCEWVLALFLPSLIVYLTHQLPLPIRSRIISTT